MYICAFSNELFTGVYRLEACPDPDAFLTSLNEADLPLPYVCDISRPIGIDIDMLDLEFIYTVLSIYGTRIHPDKQYFKITLEAIRRCLDILIEVPTPLPIVEPAPAILAPKVIKIPTPKEVVFTGNKLWAENRITICRINRKRLEKPRLAWVMRETYGDWQPVTHSITRVKK